MAVITFYNATKMDEFQLTDGLRGTDHYWEFKPEPISVATLNPDAEVISVFVGSNVTREIIDRLPKLKLIAARSTGFDHIDVKYASERGITVTNVPTYGENTVAEHAFALLLALSRKLIPAVEDTAQQLSPHQSSQYTKNEAWRDFNQHRSWRACRESRANRGTAQQASSGRWTRYN